MHLEIQPDFTWNDRWNGKQEPFWIIIDNEQDILHSEYFVLSKKDTQKKKNKKKIGFGDNSETMITFFVPY